MVWVEPIGLAIVTDIILCMILYKFPCFCLYQIIAIRPHRIHSPEGAFEAQIALAVKPKIVLDMLCELFMACLKRLSGFICYFLKILLVFFDKCVYSFLP